MTLAKNEISGVNFWEAVFTTGQYTIHEITADIQLPREENNMNLFHKTTQVVLRSEEQRDEYIEKLQKAHVDYRVFEDQETVYSRDKRFIFRINAADLKKVS